MPTLLQIDSSPSPFSVSRELTAEFVKRWKEANPEGRVVVRDLVQNPPAPVNSAWIGAAYVPKDTRTAEQNAALAQSDTLVDELLNADEVVIGVAMHNFSISSYLKLWIDQVVRVGRTFRIGPEGYVGLVSGKKVTIVAASGADYSEGSPFAAYNHADPYVAAVLGFLGVKDVKVIQAGGTAQLRSPDVDRATFLKPVIEKLDAVFA
jgi:FMN-dependent NADH-azoreductase